MNQLVVDMLLSLPSRSINIHFVDLAFSAQASFLTRNLDEKIYGKLISSSNDWNHLKDSLREKMAKALEEYGDVAKYNDSKNRVVVPYDVVVINDYQKCVNEMSDLDALFENGHKGGIYFILMNNLDFKSDRDIDSLMALKDFYQVLELRILATIRRMPSSAARQFLITPFWQKPASTILTRVQNCHR